MTSARPLGAPYRGGCGERLRFVLLAALLLALAGAGTGSVFGATLTDVASSRGLSFTCAYGSPFTAITNPELTILSRNMGNGAAVGDYDNDGDLDVYLLSQLGNQNVLFRNNLDETGTPDFTDVTATAGVGDTGFSRVAQFADLDNDGFLDLILVNDSDGTVTYPASKIYKNNGNGTFSDVTSGSGFAPTGYIRAGLSITDYDQDGRLDIYVTNWCYEVGSGSPFLPYSNILYRNIGSFVFSDTTTTAGLGGLSRDSFTGVFADVNDDTYPDLWVAVDHTFDEFYWNNAGTFQNATQAVGCWGDPIPVCEGPTHIGNDMGLTAADFDDDDDLDFYATNITDDDGIYGTDTYNPLHVNQDVPNSQYRFEDESIVQGVNHTYWGWGVDFTDFDNDRDLDLMAVNGFDEFIVTGPVGPSSAVAYTPTVLFERSGTTFTRIYPAGLSPTPDSRALVVFDYDRDGDEDYLVTNTNQPIELLENQTSPQGNWLQIALRQSSGSNLFGIGARIYATFGTSTIRRDLLGTRSYLAGVPPEIQVGMGAASTVDTLQVVWSDGNQQSFSNVLGNRYITIDQDTSANDPDLDGVADTVDCLPGDATAWNPPLAANDLSLAGGGTTTLSWSAPEPGALTETFDLLRSSGPGGFATASCLESGDSDTVAQDAAQPAAAFYYLVRTTNVCGNGLGESSAGPRAAISCP